MFSGSRMWTLGAVAAQILLVDYAMAQQGTAVLTGTVKDASSGAALPNVVVTVTSPALQGEQIVVTDGSGSYRVPNLPPGAYAVALEGDGYKPWSRGGVTLMAETTIRLNAQLLPDTLKAEEVEVVAEAPTVDIGSSSTGKSINKEFARRVPVMAPGGKGSANRSFEAVAASTPGAKADTYGVSMSGTTSPENQYALDGLSVNNPAYGFNGAPLSTEFVAEVNIISGGYMPEYGRATGAIVNAVTKTGSNEFAGSVWAFVSPGALEGPRTQVKAEGDAVRTVQKPIYSGDVGFDIGGPIQKDKVWFYLGFDVAQDLHEMTTGVYRRELTNSALPWNATTNPWRQTDGITDTTLVPGSEDKRNAKITTLQVFGKLTMALNPDNKLHATVLYSPFFTGGGGDFSINPRTGQPERDVRNPATGEFNALAHKRNGSALDLMLKWNSENDNKRLLFDTSLGWHHEENSTLGDDGSSVGGSGLAAVPSTVYRRNRPRYVGGPTAGDPAGGVLQGAGDGFHNVTHFPDRAGIAGCAPFQVANPAFDPAGPASAANPQFFEYNPCPVRTYVIGGPGSIQEQSLNRYYGSEVATYFAEAVGHHTIKLGVEAEYTDYRNKWGYSGGRALREATSGTNFLANRGGGYLTGPDQFVFIPFTDATSHSISTGAFVQDSWSVVDKVTLNAGVRWDSQWIYGGDGEIALSLPNQISPRIGLIYDPTQEGRSKLYGNWARFYESVPLDLADRSGTNRPSAGDIHLLGDCDPRDAAQAVRGGACWSDATRAHVGDTFTPDQTWILLGAGKTPIDPDIKAQSSDEFVVGGEYEVITDARAGVSYKKRMMNSVIEDMSRDEAVTYFIGNPGTGISTDFPLATRDYDEVTVQFDKQWKNQWLASLSYTWSHLRGNYSGLFRPETGQLDPNINSDFDLISLLDNRTGDLPGDRRHYIKLYGAKEFSLTETSIINAGASAVAHSGAPTNVYGSHELYGNDESFIIERGLGKRLPWVITVDTNLGYKHKLDEKMAIEFTVEVYNLLGLQAITGYDQRYTTDAVGPNLKGLSSDDGTITPPEKISSVGELDDIVNRMNANDSNMDGPVLVRNTNFGNPSAYQAPRTFRFGVRFSY